METMYDQWLKAEKKKIHDKHEEKRQELNGQAFLLGLNSDCWNRESNENKQRNAEIVQKIKDETVAEQTEIDEFMKTINTNWDSHVNDVLSK